MTDLSSKKFGRLTVSQQYGRNSYKRILWLCACVCGNSAIISGKSLNNGWPIEQVIEQCVKKYKKMCDFAEQAHDLDV